MSKVINLQDRIQSINNNKKNELEIRRKKILNKKTTFHLNYCELFVLIMELVDNLSGYDSLAKDTIKSEECNDSLEIYTQDALKITRLIKKLYKKYLNNDCFSDSKIQLTLSEIELCIEALELTCDPFEIINEDFTFEDKYEEFDRYYKTAFYLYTIFKNEKKAIIEKAEHLEKEILSEYEFKKYEEVKNSKQYHRMIKYNEARDILCNTYKNHYIEEYRSKIQFIYESTSYIGKDIFGETYFIKGNSTFNRFMAKYKYYVESKNFTYFCEGRLFDEKEMNPDLDYFPPGWRFLAGVPTEEEYEEEMDKLDDYGYHTEWMEYEDFVLSNIKDEIKNCEEMKNFKFEVIDYKEQQEIHNHFMSLNMRLLGKFDIIRDEYDGTDNIICPDGEICNEFDSIILLHYEKINKR